MWAVEERPWDVVGGGVAGLVVAELPCRHRFPLSPLPRLQPPPPRSLQLPKRPRRFRLRPKAFQGPHHLLSSPPQLPHHTLSPTKDSIIRNKMVS